MKFTTSRTAILLVTMGIAAYTGFLPAVTVLAEDNSVYGFMPHFENHIETDHFVLRWTNRSIDPRDNIGDPQIIKDTAGYLETAWGKYTVLFGRHPYTPPGKDKIEVVFQDIDSYGLAYPPDGPIQFNADAWLKQSGIRQPTSAHELFHKLQYAYGYMTRWKPQTPYLWYIEGTATWSETFVWGRVSRIGKAEALLRDANLDLYEADYTAMPFWVYFVRGNREHPDNQLMVRFFEECDRLGDGNLALNEVIKETYGSPEDFIKTFDRDRRSGFLTDASDIANKRIQGPDGKDPVKQANNVQAKGAGNKLLF